MAWSTRTSASSLGGGATWNSGAIEVKTPSRTRVGGILEFPDSGRPFGRRLRRTLVRGFPYGLLYRVEPSRILIVAVAHLHRRPGYWRSRLG
jgi:hypothetical protein